ncbi:UNVERIFIED_CONTAM: hypothetical protein FKN15_074015 [Acipenser sinensis]
MANLSLNCSSQEYPQPLEDSPNLCNGSSLNHTLNQTWNLEDYFMSNEELLIKYLGPRRSSVFLPVCITYLTIFVVGACGNTLICIVIAQHKVMRTTTNYYLFSLAISDLLVLLLGMPLELSLVFLRTMANLSLNCSSQEYPQPLEDSPNLCNGSSLNHTLNQTWNLEDYFMSNEELLIKYLGPRRSRVFLPVCITYLTIFVVGACGNALICIVIAQHKVMRTTTNYYLFSLAISDLLVLLLGMPLELYEMWSNYPFLFGKGGLEGLNYKCWHSSFVLVVVFGICWAPFHTDRLTWSFIEHWTGDKHLLFQYVHILSGVFFYLSSAVNPILYNLMSTRFREMFKDVMCQGSHRPNGRKYSLSITRVTTRSVVCEPPPGHGPALSDVEDYELYLECNNENETSFA